MKSLRNMIESILITEITKLYEKAATPMGLSIEDVKKLEVFVKIKDLENPEEPKDQINPLNKTLKELKELAKSGKPDNE